MAQLFMSSGEMIADRRFDYGRDLELRGDLAAAADLFLQAIEIAPDFASAWFALGDVRERLGDIDGAIDAFAHASAAKGGDILGADLRLMRLTGGAAAAMAPDYVTALYDQYADRFEQSLVGELGYRGPALLLAAVGHERRFQRAIDLGCGTGLAAAAFASLVDSFVGIDLSRGMIRQAEATGRYAALHVMDATAGLEAQPTASADLVLAADMMIYVHDLAPLFRETARVLTPGGLFAFTAETHDAPGVILGPGLRYAQSAAHLRGLLAEAGLTVAGVDHSSIRTERDVPVPSLVITARKH